MARASLASHAYFDTSALIKRYVAESGRREVMQLLRTHACVVSAVLPLEIRSALRRRLTDGTLDEAQVDAILKRLATDRAFWTVVDVSRDVLAAAESLGAVHPLRALAAIHVASAQLVAERLGSSRLIFVSADVRQTATASAVRVETRRIE